MKTLIVRDAASSETGVLALLWRDGWREAHAGALQDEGRAEYALSAFVERMAAAVFDVRVVGEINAPKGFSLLIGDEVQALHVQQSARRQGVGAALLGDAMHRFRARGLPTAHLYCPASNEGAARFFQRHGWRRAGAEKGPLRQGDAATFADYWRFEKAAAA